MSDTTVHAFAPDQSGAAMEAAAQAFVEQGARLAMVEEELRAYQMRHSAAMAPARRLSDVLAHSRDKCPTITEARTHFGDLLDALGGHDG